MSNSEVMLEKALKLVEAVQRDAFWIIEKHRKAGALDEALEEWRKQCQITMEMCVNVGRLTYHIKKAVTDGVAEGCKAARKEEDNERSGK